MKTKNRASMPDWLEQAFAAAAAAPPGNGDEEDDCPICRAMRANTDPSSVRTTALGDGSVLEIVTITSSAD